jgi:hypothetical protein
MNPRTLEAMGAQGRFHPFYALRREMNDSMRFNRCAA